MFHRRFRIPSVFSWAPLLVGDTAEVVSSSATSRTEFDSTLTTDNIGVPSKLHCSTHTRVFCVFSSHSFWTSSSLDVPAGVTQEECHTGFLIHLLSAVRTLIFLARRIQPFLSLVDREVEFCVLPGNDLIVLHPLGIFIFVFYFFSEKNPVCRDRTHVPTCQKATRYL